MVIHITGSLQVGIADGGAEELEAATLHILAYGIAHCGRGRNVGQRLGAVNNRLAVWQERADVGVE